jgi:hypothetical protein
MQVRSSSGLFTSGRENGQVLPDRRLAPALSEAATPYGS